jgi:hypothetical protein
MSVGVPLTVAQRVNEFRAKHGGESRDGSVADGNWFLYSNGARREQDPWGALCEPPTDAKELALMVGRYWSIRLKHASDAFNEKRDHYRQQAKIAIAIDDGIVPNPPAPTASAIAELKELKAEVVRCQRKLNEARADHQDYNPQWKKDREADNKVYRQANADFLNAVEAIEI